MQLPLQQLRSNRSAALRSHRIDFSETTERAGFPIRNRQLKQAQAWQFQLTANEHGPIHGILLTDIYFVIWIDPLHKLYE